MEGPLGLAVGRGRTCSTPEGPTAQPPRHSTTAEAARTQGARGHIGRNRSPQRPGGRRPGMPVGSRRRAAHGWVGLGPRGSIEDQPRPAGPPAPEPRLRSIGWRRVAQGVVAAGKVASELRCAAIPLAAAGRSMPRRVWSGWRPSCLPPSKPATWRRSGRCWPLTPGGDHAASKRCRSRTEVVDTFRRQISAGVERRVSALEVGPEGILCPLAVTSPAVGEGRGPGLFSISTG